jgi:sulfite exporter TauE/SafE
MTTTLLAALIAGFAGSAHCFGMCGGVAGALGMRARQNSASPFQGSLRALLYHVGRIGGYASVGAIGGAFGHSAHWALSLTRFEAALRITAGVLTLLIAVRLLTRWNAFAPLERLGARLWIKLQPVSRRASLSNHWSGSLATGLLWGWLPCGLVYSVALMTFTTASALDGAAVMVAFGLGTLPMMASASLLLAGAWPKLTQKHWFRATAATVLFVCGTWTIVATQWTHSSHSITHSEAQHH